MLFLRSALVKAPLPTPLTESPLTESPLTESPLTESPLTESPLTESPLTESPLTESPLSLLISASCSPSSDSGATSAHPQANSRIHARGIRMNTLLGSGWTILILSLRIGFGEH